MYKVTMRVKLLFHNSNVPAERVLWLICAILFALPSYSYPQQPDKIPRIGFLQRRVPPTADNPDPLGAAFRQGLRDLGYIDGKNIRLEHRYAHGRSDLLPSLIAEFIQLKVDVIVVASIQAIRAAAQATKAIPIVIVSQTDPVTDGFVHSLARPGGNITGLMRLTSELSGKRLEFLKQAVPRVSRVGILGGSTNLQAGLHDYEPAAHAQQITLQLLELREPNPDFVATFQGAANAGVNAIITNRDALTASHLKRIADQAIKHRLPSMNEDSPYVEAGGLMSYATKDADQFRRAAIYVDKILKGTKPADLPVEQPTKFELVINVKTAKQIGLTIPPNVLARADRVIR